MIPLDMREGETVAGYVARKNAALIENRIKHEWLNAVHPDLLSALLAWGTASPGEERAASWVPVERYLVANLKDDPA